MDKLSLMEAWDKNYKLYKEIDREYHRLAMHYGLSDSEFFSLYSLYEAETDVSAQDIVMEWTYSKQTVHSAIKSLEKRDLIRTEDDPRNKRRRIIRLTPRGEDLAAKIMPDLMTAERLSFCQVPEQVLRNFNHTLTVSLSSFREAVQNIIQK